MKAIIGIAVLAALLCVIAVSTNAAGKITVDPNETGAAEPLDAVVEPTDARLDQPITCQFRQETVLTILSTLSLSGVKLKAGWSELDWQVRERKMTIFAKDMPLRSLMSSISRVMKFSWVRGGKENEWYYRLYVDRSTLSAAQAKQAEADKRLNEEVTKRRHKFVDDTMNLKDDPSEAELARLKEENPYVYSLYEKGSLAFIKGLFTEAPQMAEGVRNCTNQGAQPSKLSPDTRQQLLHVMQEMWKINGDRWAGNGTPFPPEVEENLRRAQITLDTEPRFFSGANTAEERLAHFGWVGVSCPTNDDPSWWFKVEHFGDLSSKTMQHRAKAELTAIEDGRDLGDVYTELEGEGNQAYADARELVEELTLSEPVVDHPDEPALLAKTKLKLDSQNKWPNLADIQSALASASGLSVVSDSFRRSSLTTLPGYSVPQNEKELKDVLDGIAVGFHYNWEKSGTAVEFRDRDWFKKRSVQIPDAWIKGWRDRTKKNGYLSLDDYTQIAALTDDQIVENILTDEVLGRLGYDFANAGLRSGRRWLQLYGHLTAKQRRAAESEHGLDLWMVSPDQWRWVEDLFKAKPGTLDDPTIPLLFTVQTTNTGPKEYKYRFVARTADGGHLHDCNLVLPKYVEPKKEQPKENQPRESKPAPAATPAPASGK